MKRFIRTCLFLSFAMLLIHSTALAANKSVWKSIKGSASNYIVTYPINSSERIYGYTDSAMTNQSGYIDPNDECWILDVSSDGKAVYVSYPWTGTNGKRLERWFHSEEFVAGDGLRGPATTEIQKSRANVYKHPKRGIKNNNYGWVVSNDSNDKVYILGFNRLGMFDGDMFTQVLYKTNNGTWKMGWK